MISWNVSIEPHCSAGPCGISEGAAPAGKLLGNVALFAILLLAAILRLWDLGQNGWGNEYYTAGVRSMMTGWSNFLYNSFDPAGFVSVDKPPIALWIQVISAEIFGFHGLSVLLPQAVEGILAVWIIYKIVQRHFGEPAGLLAALFLAITPVSVAIDRSSNTDSCLVLVLLLAAWALIRAAESGSRRFFVLSMGILGIGFNVKMLAAYVVLPSFVLVYLLAAPITLGSRIQHLAIGGLVLTVVSLCWVLVYDFTPPDRRPFAGTTKNNSILELALGPYAVGRFLPPVKPTDHARIGRKSWTVADSDAESVARKEFFEELRRSNLGLRLFILAPPGPFRLADGQLAGQVGWLIPLAIIGCLVSALKFPFRRPMAKEHSALLLWLCWTLTYGIVYSSAGGIVHLYYLATIAPSLAALAGIGVIALWDKFIQNGRLAALLPVSLVLTAIWQFHIESSALGWNLSRVPAAFSSLTAICTEFCHWPTLLHAAMILGIFISAAGLFTVFFAKRPIRIGGVLAIGSFGLGISSLLLVPMAWALSVVLLPGHGTLPSADLARLTRPAATPHKSFRSKLREGTDYSKLISFLKNNHSNERYLLATSTAQYAAPIIIRTGEPVMARGGFHGLDPILTPEKFAEAVQNGQIRFAMIGDASRISIRLGAESAGRPIADWIKANGRLVDSDLWRSFHDRNDKLLLYDLRPELPVVPGTDG